jgi:hypothetical protein
MPKTRVKKTHNGTKIAKYVECDTAAFYFSKPVNTKRGGAFVTIIAPDDGGGSPRTIRLSGKELSALRRMLSYTN